jgi:hypothetical protein
MGKKTITQKFIKGLKKYNMTIEELSKDWKYCGGTQGRHYNYYQLMFPGESLCEHRSRCICNTRIKHNCYLTNGVDTLVLGNCCIKRFVEKKGRTCSNCGESHKNRITILCKTCRVGRCDICSAPATRAKCNDCYYGRTKSTVPRVVQEPVIKK